MSLIVKLLINAAAVFLGAKFLEGVKVKNFLSAVLVAAIIGIVNATIKPILIFLTIPATILTLGLFLFVIDALMILLVDKLLTGFEVKNFGWAILFSIVLSVINAIFYWII
ncbi:MAG: phage holin family protein [Bacteroidetes bacterium]|nr:MAG: phage holin family protein [Bacteroidota bacterium]MBL1143672.1 phage holin family protein [Bacteroidota bacterium]MCB0801850.1 phage holin family protein [Flavobacteriales bacterium]NOG56474.1 phage holin family protein [Bacteroidota bacterium]